MDTAQWPQRIGLVRPMEELETSSTNNTSTANNACSTTRPQLVERKPRPQREQALNCPRCTSTNTKFCYYNNYSLTQPRYFCKTCRRYWTEGGSLRNVPVGGGSRKNKRSYTSTTSSSTTTTTTTHNNNNNINTTTGSSVSTSMKLPSGLIPSPISLQNPKFLEGQDLNLSFPSHSMPQFGDFPNIGSNNSSNSSNKPSTAFGSLSAMELLRSKISAKGLGPFMPMQMAMPEAGVGYPSGFDLQDMKPCTAGLNLDGIGVGGEGGGSGYGSIQGVQDSGRLLFPFEDLRQVSSGASAEFEHNRGQGGDPPAFWNGMMGGGGGGGPW